MSQIRVLVVEDELMIRETLVELLVDEGFEVASASNGEEALRSLAKMPQVPQVIVLDLMMPVMNGRDFRQQQLATAAIASIPVLLMSAYQNLAETARELGCAMALTKPLDLDRLVAGLRALAA